ncbi:uncharacterized protein LOC121015594 isoform X2 [Herpailurus yagouaroundi]|uniref:uncharacterized protein LOC121015594 isoform X2 n=1 Tax=Herpailurus yagouaroundi TaxID=1608482 RepID=UPI001AD6C0B8|nr:uncharacterized protein LOC121015594 isoform X2 [Puma yagouaroundi]
MRVAGRNNSFPRPFFLPQTGAAPPLCCLPGRAAGERKSEARGIPEWTDRCYVTVTGPHPRATGGWEPRERQSGGRQGPPSRLSSSQKRRGWASGSSGLGPGPVSPSSWATTLAFRLLTWGGWVLATLPPAFLHSWARAASSTTDSSRAIPREWKSHAQGHSAGWWKCQEAASSSPARPCPLCLMCPVGTSLPDSPWRSGFPRLGPCEATPWRPPTAPPRARRPPPPQARRPLQRSPRWPRSCLLLLHPRSCVLGSGHSVFQVFISRISSFSRGSASRTS